MQILDNITTTIKDDLKVCIRKDSKLSIAAACFSIYAYQELKNQKRKICETERCIEEVSLSEA